jgi:hypothetical protein
MDGNLAYLKFIADYANQSGVDITPNALKELGKSVPLYPGLDTWFDRINEYGKSKGVDVEHYVISCGLKDMIEGTSIGKHFKDIFACSFVYDENGRAIWPQHSVNYTTKTQYPPRISKGSFDLTDDISVNNFMPQSQRPIPLKNFICIADSETDIPMMKMIKTENGRSIGVYDPLTKNTKRCHELIGQGRINYYAPANYSKDSCIEKIVFSCIDNIKANDKLRNLDLRYLPDSISTGIKLRALHNQQLCAASIGHCLE